MSHKLLVLDSFQNILEHLRPCPGQLHIFQTECSKHSASVVHTLQSVQTIQFVHILSNLLTKSHLNLFSYLILSYLILAISIRFLFYSSIWGLLFVSPRSPCVTMNLMLVYVFCVLQEPQCRRTNTHSHTHTCNFRAYKLFIKDRDSDCDWPSAPLLVSDWSIVPDGSCGISPLVIRVSQPHTGILDRIVFELYQLVNIRNI